MKNILFPVIIKIVIDKKNGKFIIASSSFRYDLNLSEYPELPKQKLKSILSLNSQESQAVLALVKVLLKNHLKQEEN